MLKKCLKHDLKYVFDYWILSTAIFTAVCIIGAICLRSTAITNNTTLLTGIGQVIFYLYSFAYMFFGAGMSIFGCYQSCFTDEGYLTFTLPVKRQTILASKALSIIISYLASIFVMAVFYHAVFAIVPSRAVGYEGMSMLARFYSTIGNALTGFYAERKLWILVYAVEIIAIVALCLTFASLFIFHCLSKYMESKKKPKRTLVQVALIYLTILPASILLVFLISQISNYSNAIALAGTLTPAESSLSVFLILLIVIAALTMLNSAQYRSSLKRISEKLNLE